MIEGFQQQVFEPMKDSLFKMMLGLAFMLIGYGLALVRRLMANDKDSRLKVTYEQLNFMLTQRSDEVLILKAELEQMKNDRDDLFIQNSDYNQEMATLKTKIFILERELGKSGAELPETPNSTKHRALYLVSEGQYERAISILKSHAALSLGDESELLNELIQISQNLSMVKRHQRKGTLDFDDYEKNINQISDALIQLINIHFK